MGEERTLQLYTLRTALLAGIEPWHRRVSVKNAVQRPAWFQRLGLLPHEHVDARREPGEILNALRRLRPDVLSGFPHVLVRLAQGYARAGRKWISPLRVISGGETLTSTAKHLIRDAFGCPVQDVDGTYQCHLVAWECGMCGRYHTSDDTVITEVLAGDRPAEPGEEGRMFITCLHSFTMPFLRFDLGDIVKLPARPAGCPVRFGQLESVVGRYRDYLPLPDGTAVAPTALTVALRDLAGLGWFQVIQEELDRVRILYEPLPDAPSDLEAQIVGRVRRVLPESVRIVTRAVDSFTLTPGGKLRVVQALPSAHAAPASLSVA